MSNSFLLSVFAATISICSFSQNINSLKLSAKETPSGYNKPVKLICNKSLVEDIYDDLDGGILESFGRLFKKNVKFYIYPIKDLESGKITTINNLEISNNLQHLYKYLLENNYIDSIHEFNPQIDFAFPKDIIDRIQNDDQSWKLFVPQEIHNLIKQNKYFCSKKMTSDLFASFCF